MKYVINSLGQQATSTANGTISTMNAFIHEYSLLLSICAICMVVMILLSIKEIRCWIKKNRFWIWINDKISVLYLLCLFGIFEPISASERIFTKIGINFAPQFSWFGILVGLILTITSCFVLGLFLYMLPVSTQFAIAVPCTLLIMYVLLLIDSNWHWPYSSKETVYYEETLH